jgi:transcriptional regulator with XRE-family HTH domain
MTTIKNVTTIDAKEIGDKLRDLRQDKTQEQVAADLGISRSSYMMYETGERIPRDSIKLKIANYYNTSVGALFFAEKSCSNAT